MKHLPAICIALILAAPIASAGKQSSPSATSILSRITKEGGHKVLWDLWEQEAAFGHVLSGIESGNATWLQVAAKLLPFSDAGASLSLHYAVAIALPKAPNRVLALVGHGFDVEYICTSPFIEPDPGIAETYERKTLVALSTVKVPSLKAVAAECSKRVRLPASASASDGA